MNKGKRTGRLIMIAGCVLIAASLALTLYNIRLENNAENAASEVLAELDTENMTADSGMQPDYIVNPDMDMPKKTVDGNDYVGLVSIPSLDITLPVMADWSYDKLKTSPCVYEGTPYKNDLIIAAHNYKIQFGPIDDLTAGDSVIFKDMDGNTFNYKVVYTEIIDEKDVDAMRAGDWDLTLFTCSYSGTTRITVRCKIAE